MQEVQLVALLLLSCAHALTIHSPDSIAGFVRSTISNKFIGDQDPNLTLTGSGTLVMFGDCHKSTFDPSHVLNKIALVYNIGRTKPIGGEDAEAKCLELAGALAVVRLGQTVQEPGLTYYWNERDLHSTTTIPVLAVAQKVVEIREAAKAGLNISLTLTADENLFRTQCFDTTEFLIIMRIILPIINVVGVIIAFEATISHFHRLWFEPAKLKTRAITATVRIMAMGSFLEFTGCTVRAVYYAMGPIMSTSDVYFTDNMYLIYIPIALNMLTTLMAASLFLRWGAFGVVDSFFKRHLDTILILAGTGFFILALILAIFQAHYVSDTFGLILVTVICGVICLAICSVAFIFSGIRFVRHLHESASFASETSSRSNSIRKAVRWISVSGVCLLIQIAGFILPSQQTWFYMPRGQFVAFGLVFYGMSLAAVSQALAFRPYAESHRGVAAKLAEMTRASLSVPQITVKRTLSRLRVAPEIQMQPMAHLVVDI
eukprot:c17567_g1_i4.p1 GENE.c17567_g1_i4~~c17567_g1_i4.p1  ORF type:complete len:488 (-),score=93.74 c17567_g1_i4:59-1522(-)